MGCVTLAAGMERGSPEYERLKEERSQVLWRAVERIIPDVRQRTEIAMVRALHAAATLAACCRAVGHPMSCSTQAILGKGSLCRLTCWFLACCNDYAP